MEIRPLATDAEARACATLMATSDPWITIGRTYEQALAIIHDDTREVYLAYEAGEFRGFIILALRGPFAGYIQTIAVVPDARGGGVGSALIRFAEERIFSEFRNVFLCVSSFNPRARALYERLGYRPIGEIPDYIIDGESELLMRKVSAPPRAGVSPGAPEPTR